MVQRYHKPLLEKAFPYLVSSATFLFGFALSFARQSDQLQQLTSAYTELVRVNNINTNRITALETKVFGKPETNYTSLASK